MKEQGLRRISCVLSSKKFVSRGSFCSGWLVLAVLFPILKQALLWLGGGTGGEEPPEATVQVCGVRRVAFLELSQPKYAAI